MESSSEIVIMSIHQAKGLQFPFVVIPDLHRKFSYSQQESMLGGVLSGRGGSDFEFGLSMSRIDGFVTGNVLMKKMKDQHQREEFAEYIRLFYVAVTRAKYGVILSGVLKEKNGDFPEPGMIDNLNGCYLDWVRVVFDLTSDTLKKERATHPFAETDIESYDPGAIDPGNISPGCTMLPLRTAPKTMPAAPIIHRMSVHELSEQCAGGNDEPPPADLDSYGKEFGTFIHWVIEHGYFDVNQHLNILCEKIASYPPEAIPWSGSVSADTSPGL